MHRKKLIITAVLLLALVLILIVHPTYSNRVRMTNVEKVYFSSSIQGKVKVITKEEDKEKIIRYLNSFIYIRVPFVADIKGWEYYIRVVGESGNGGKEVRVSFVPFLINTSEGHYFIGGSSINRKLESLYNEMIYEEKRIGED